MKALILWISCLGWLLMLPLHGQAPDPEERETTGRRAWIVATSIPEDVPNPLSVLSADRLHEVQLHLRSIGSPFPVDEAGAVRAVKSMTKSDGELIYKDLARCVIPKNVREALIVLVPRTNGKNEEESDGLTFKANVIDLSKFKKGGCLYVNLVKAKIGVTFGDVKAVVPPGGMEFINMETEKNTTVKPIRFFYEIPKKPKAEWKLMTASQMAIYKSRREICVFFYNEEIENIDFRGIPFITPPPRPKPKNR